MPDLMGDSLIDILCEWMYERLKLLMNRSANGCPKIGL